ncbi:N-acetylmuramoyl-L-alanine amidase [Tuberibacillus sp. Marseille-P3662]|uniref:N-acetylmuramoyl-L-alanine amidase n=1 Tax=Tuberibacillus sp. Marseille-P3662 TaxID=1965358 RepID=UPI000A1CAE35|nr:N-acetylmuramoyl-L-alanine amidase [Tuberibacillus sp. Marseille-P3662]
MVRKLLLLFGGLFLSLGLFQQTAAATPNFPDVPDNYRAAEEINYLFNQGIIEGFRNGTFHPNEEVTRADAAVMIGKALNLDGTKQSTKFPDVAKDFYASGYIQSAYEKGIITGYSDGNYRPHDNVKREEMAFLISRAFSLNETGFLSYTDIKQNDQIYKPINEVTTAGITNGFPNHTFRPDAYISRADFSLMVARAINEKFRVTITQSISGNGVVTADVLHVRRGPSTNYDIVDKLYMNDSVKIYNRVGHWAFVQNSNTKGYVHMNYIREADEVLENRVVTIDAGHGGHDPGATGQGLKEKNINLQVAKKVAKHLKDMGLSPFLTRDDDTFYELQERVDMSERAGAEAFVSIHANSFKEESANGTETYYYSADVNPYGKQSRKLADFIQDRMVEVFNLNDSENRGIKYGNFHVLRENSVPAALVELGFITNPSDAEHLSSPAWQDRAAKAIALGISDFFHYLYE